MKKVKIVLLVLVLTVIAVAVYNYPRLNMISGYAAKNMASSVFLANRLESSINEVDNNIPLIKNADSKVDTASKSATASVYGLLERKAIYREGLGAVLVPNDTDISRFTLKPKRNQIPTDLAFPYGEKEQEDTIFANIRYTSLDKGVDFAFSSPETQKTKSVIVVYKNKIIAEKYAGDITKNTKVLGWSMTKSIIATLYGILQFEGKLNIEDAAPIPAWQQDDRKNITLNHLLRMQSSLAWEEDYTKISDVTQMLFLDADMTLAQQEKQALAKPTEIWNYSSGTSNLLSGILKTKFNTLQEYLDFPYTDLIDKIGMHSMVLEADMEGNYVGSSYAWATTRDWAKFGLLYLHKGNWNGTQIFESDWVDYITKPTLHSNGTYGAHFWLNAAGKFPDVPRDMYSANGFLGQRVFIIPSKDLVVVRTGLAEAPYFDTNLFLAGIIAAIEQ
ncbi:beta-lactamase family protein [Cellulophaga sp. F20128]|uniref:serine hydrolase domain-containing protein n=1 Tax=Cellulophaga sp. F20128 TaxID=2926413 RepID=UPI001FF34FB1|nr:serine hydrolase [Cellulophaga sp. F20128]MCK0158161.1 beta-lactamase family protein [Cellulophaga sp. F20128]